MLVAVECRQKLVLLWSFKVREILSKELLVVITSFYCRFCLLLEYNIYSIITTEEPQEIAIAVFVQRKQQQKMHQAETAKKLRGLPAFFYSHRCVPRLLDFLIAAGKLFLAKFSQRK